MGQVAACMCTVFPAYVGMSPEGCDYKKQGLGVPRIRGDEPGFSAKAALSKACSPHTWG